MLNVMIDNNKNSEFIRKSEDLYHSHSEIDFSTMELFGYNSDKLTNTINYLGQSYKKTYGI